MKERENYSENFWVGPTQYNVGAEGNTVPTTGFPEPFRYSKKDIEQLRSNAKLNEQKNCIVVSDVIVNFINSIE